MRLQLIKNEQFKIRTVRKGGETWFVGRDAAEILGYTNPHKAVVDHVDEDDRFLERIVTQKGVRKAVVINEIGIYSLILSSSLPAAKDFKRWLCGEVIPSLRQNGAYLTDAALDAARENPQALQQLTDKLAEERQKHCETLKLLGERETALQERDALIERKNAYFIRNKPRIDFARAVYENRTAILVGEMAKLLAQNGVEIGQNRFFEWLRENGYLQRKQGQMWNIPYQRCVDAGLFIIKESVGTSPRDGREYITRTPMVTGKGQRYFISKFLQTKDEEALAALDAEELRLAADRAESDAENVSADANGKAQCQNAKQNADAKAKVRSVNAKQNTKAQGPNAKQNADAKAQGVNDRAKVKREEEDYGEDLEAIADSWEDSEPVEPEEIAGQAEEVAELAEDEW